MSKRKKHYIVSGLENRPLGFQAAGKSLPSHAKGACADYAINRRPPFDGPIRGKATNASKTDVFKVQ